MKKNISLILIWLGKAFVGGGIALLVASVLCLVYYNPAKGVDTPEGPLKMRCERNSLIIQMIEGIAWGHTDENGFYNLPDCVDYGMDILVLGSSHMAAEQVKDTEKMPYKLEQYTGKTTYNLGFSGYKLVDCARSLPLALEQMAPKEYVVVEIPSAAIDLDTAQEIYAEKSSGEVTSQKSVLYLIAKNIPYMRLLKKQFQDYYVASVKSDVIDEILDVEKTQQIYLELIEYMSLVTSEYGVKLIILVHPFLEINEDGTASENEDPHLDYLEFACEKNGVVLVNTQEDFHRLYDKKHVMPNGFCNSAVGFGHLNKYGLDVMAEKLAKVIGEMETEN